MIIVMPNGDTDGSWAGGSSPEGIEMLGQELLTDIIPMIDRTYRVAPGRENRAITGLSMGGGQAFTIGLKHLDLFAWVGEFSSGLVSDTEFHLEKHLPGLSGSSRRSQSEAEAVVSELRHGGSAVSGTARSGGQVEGSTTSTTSGIRPRACTSGRCGGTRWPSSRRRYFRRRIDEAIHAVAAARCWHWRGAHGRAGGQTTLQSPEVSDRPSRDLPHPRAQGLGSDADRRLAGHARRLPN